MNTDPTELEELEEAVLGMRFPLTGAGAFLALGLLSSLGVSFVFLGVGSTTLVLFGTLILGLPMVLLLGAGLFALLGREDPHNLVRSVYVQVAFWWMIVVTGGMGLVFLLLLGASMVFFVR